MCDDVSMSTPPGGPSGPHVPPPPGGSSGQPPYGAPDPYGQVNPHGQTGPYGQAGQGPGGPPPGGYGPGPTGPGGQPPKKGPGKGLIFGIAGGLVLVLLLCCIGGFFLARGSDDDESTSSTTTSETSQTTSETSEPTSETSEPTSETTEPTSETTSDSTSAGGDVSFPDEFDGWKSGSTTDVAGQSAATYTKGTDAISVIASDVVTASQYEAIWEDSEKVGDLSCGTASGSSSTGQCAGEKDGTTYLLSAVNKDTKETAAILEKFLDAI